MKTPNDLRISDSDASESADRSGRRLAVGGRAVVDPIAEKSPFDLGVRFAVHLAAYSGCFDYFR